MDYAGNSKKDKEKAEKLEKKEVERVITGEVIQRPKGVGRKFKEVFFGGDAKQMVSYVGTDVLLPALRNLIVDAITKGVEGLVYGPRNSPRRGPSINYSGMSRRWDSNPISRPYDSRPSYPAPPSLPRGRQNRTDIGDIVLATREEGEIVIERMQDILDKYDVTSLADLYALLGLPTSPIDHKWGWSNLTGSDVRQIRNGFLLELPPLSEI